MDQALYWLGKITDRPDIGCGIASLEQFCCDLQGDIKKELEEGDSEESELEDGGELDEHNGERFEEHYTAVDEYREAVEANERSPAKEEKASGSLARDGRNFMAYIVAMPLEEDEGIEEAKGVGEGDKLVKEAEKGASEGPSSISPIIHSVVPGSAVRQSDTLVWDNSSEQQLAEDNSSQHNLTKDNSSEPNSPEDTSLDDDTTRARPTRPSKRRKLRDDRYPPWLSSERLPCQGMRYQWKEAVDMA